MCELRGEGTEGVESDRRRPGVGVRHAGMHACDAWPSGTIALSCQAAATSHPYCIYLLVETTAGRPAGGRVAQAWLAATCCAVRPPRAACMHALLGAASARFVRPPLSLSPSLDRRRYLLASGEKKKSYCYAIVPLVRARPPHILAN